MTAVRVYRTGLNTVTPVATKVRVYRTGVTGTLVPVSPTRIRVHRSGLFTSSALQPPIVNAGGNVSVESGAQFTLVGTHTDLDGTVVSWEWVLNSVQLATTSTLVYTAPVVAVDTDFTFTYSATDNNGLVGSDIVVVSVRRATILRKNSDGSMTGFVIRRKV